METLIDKMAGSNDHLEVVQRSLDDLLKVDKPQVNEVKPSVGYGPRVKTGGSELSQEYRMREQLRGVKLTGDSSLSGNGSNVQNERRLTPAQRAFQEERPKIRQSLVGSKTR